MSEHPDAATLAALSRGKLSKEEMQPVVAHLLRGCEACWEAVGPAAEAFLERRFTVPPPRPDVYDLPIRRAEKMALRLERETRERGRERAYTDRDVAVLPAARGRRDLAPGPTHRTRGLAWCEKLRAAAHALRHSDPWELVTRANAAVGAAEMLDPAAHPAGAVAEMRAAAWAELGNAHRVANDLAKAETCLLHAMDKAREGSGNPLLLARLMDLTASLYTDQRRFADAQELLGKIAETYAQRGEKHLEGRALISRGVSVGYANRLEEAILWLQRGLQRIDLTRDPRLALAAVHSLIDFKIKLGGFAEARSLLRKSHRLYAAFGDELYFLKVRWIEAKIEAGLGEWPHAEAALIEVRESFRGREMPYTAAVVALDLAAVWLRQGKTAALRELVESMVLTFRSLGIRREAIASLLFLQAAVRAERATLALIRTAAAEIERLERTAAGARKLPETREEE